MIQLLTTGKSEDFIHIIDVQMIWVVFKIIKIIYTKFNSVIFIDVFTELTKLDCKLI